MKGKPQYIILLYLAVSISWILVSDYLVEVSAFITGINSNTLQTGKGLFFVFATGLLLYILLRNQYYALDDNREQYKNLFHSNPHPLWIYERKTLKFLEVNDAAIRIYGFSCEEFKKMTILDIRPKEDHEKVLKTVCNLPDHYRFSGVFRHIKKGGEAVTVSITSNKINFNKKECGIVLAQDITVRLQQEERLKLSYTVEKQLRKELENNLELLKRSLQETKKREHKINEQNKILRRHSWMNSHAIRKPLASILSLVSLSKDIEHVADIKELHSLIEVSSKELDTIIKKVGKEINDFEKE